MILTVLMFVVALSLSGVAAFYSIVGLTAIFAAAVLPIILMGSILEVAKLTVTVWLHEYWSRARWLMKIYLSTAVVVLMIITSMGIFGFLSKAHSDQGMISGDVLAKISIYDEKIKTAKDNIEANRKALKQMDEAVDQVMGRSTDEKGADKAVQIRRSQQKERTRLIAEIETEQKKIAGLNEERAPIAAEVRKVEAEVGPIKYIAALIYGDNPDANLLERAVRWVIILLVIVFDPLAVMMLLAATESRKWLREDRVKPNYEPDDGPLTQDQINQLKEIASKDTQADVVEPDRVYPATDQELEEFSRAKEEARAKVRNEQPNSILKEIIEDESDEPDAIGILNKAKVLWKSDNPGNTLKEQRKLLQLGEISHLPWEDYIYDARTQLVVGFGNKIPKTAIRGEQFVLTSKQPTQLYKYNGTSWIQIDKNGTDSYAYNQDYINYLISALDSGEYGPDLLTDIEKNQIEICLHNKEV